MVVVIFPGHLLKAETMVNALPIIELQLYMNPVLHYLLPPALIYLIVRRRPVYRGIIHKIFPTTLISCVIKYTEKNSTRMSSYCMVCLFLEELLAEYRQIRRLLKYEFFYMEESEDRVSFSKCN